MDQMKVLVKSELKATTRIVSAIAMGWCFLALIVLLAGG